MNSFIEKIKKLILTEATFGELEQGTYSVRNPSRREGVWKETPTSAQRTVAINASKRLSGQDKSDEGRKVATEDSGIWSSVISERTYKTLNDYLGREVKLWLDDNTAMHLNLLFDKLLGTDDEGHEKISGIKVTFEEKRNENFKKRLLGMLKLTNNFNFRSNHRMLIDFLSNDVRFSPRFYTINLTIPIESYNETDLRNICSHFNTNFAQLGIQNTDLTRELNVTISVSSMAYLINIYSTDISQQYFSVATNANALLKYCWTLNQIRNIFATNTKATDKRYINASMDSGIQFAPVDVLGLVYAGSSGHFVQDAIYCFVDDTNGTYLYIPGDELQEEQMIFLSPNPDESTWKGKISKIINQYISGVVPINSVDKIISRFAKRASNESDQEVSALNSKIYDIVYDFTKSDLEGVTPWGSSSYSGPSNYAVRKATKLKADIERYIYEANIEDDKKIPYDTIINSIDQAIGVFGVVDTRDPNFKAAISNIKNSLNDTIRATSTDIDDFKKLLKIFKAAGKQIKVFKFMYNNAVDMNYSIDIPVDIANKLLKPDVTDETNGIKVACKNHTTDEKWLSPFGVKKLKKALDDAGITEDPKTWLKKNYVCPACIETVSVDDKTKNILSSIYNNISDDLVLQSIDLKDQFGDGIVVPGAQNLTRTTTRLVRKIQLDHGSGKENLKYVLVTTAKNTAKQPSGSLYGAKYDSVPEGPDVNLSVSETITSICGLRQILGDLINAFYFMPTENDLNQIKSGDTVNDEFGNVYSIDSGRVKYAIDNIKGDNPTLILRTKPQEIIQAGEEVVQFGKLVYMSNGEFLDTAFSDYYDGLTYWRNQVERIMEQHGIKLPDNGKNANQLRKSGRPAVINGAVKGIKEDIVGAVRHELTFNREVSKQLSDSRIGAKILAYIKHIIASLQSEASDDIKNKFSKATISLSKDTKIDNVNFSGDKLFVQNERDAWLNGNESPLIPFLNAYKNNNLNTEIEKNFKSICAKNKTDMEADVITEYYKYICELCGYVNNFNKLLISDGHRARVFDKQQSVAGFPIVTRIDTGIPYFAIYDEDDRDNKKNIINTTDDDEIENNRKETMQNTVRDANAAQLNTGLIVDKFVDDNFRPIVSEIRNAVQVKCERMQKLNGGTLSSYKKPIGMSTSESEIPFTTFHTVVYATVEGEDQHIILSIVSSCVAAKPEDCDISNPSVNDFAYDKDEKYIKYVGSYDALNPELVLTSAENVANSDIGYNAIYMMKENFFFKFIQDMIEKMEDDSVDLFSSLRNYIAGKLVKDDVNALQYIDYVNNIKDESARNERNEMFEAMTDNMTNEIKTSYMNAIKKNIDSLYKLMVVAYILKQ